MFKYTLIENRIIRIYNIYLLIMGTIFVYVLYAQGSVKWCTDVERYYLYLYNMLYYMY